MDHINSLNLGKSSGIDRLTSELVRASLPVMLEAYTKLFNAVRTSEQYACAWNKGYIVNIYTTGGQDGKKKKQGQLTTYLLSARWLINM
jgi:hypothetical protein